MKVPWQLAFARIKIFAERPKRICAKRSRFKRIYPNGFYSETFNLNYLRECYACWQKRERGETLDEEGYEIVETQEFDQILKKALLSQDPRPFMRQLAKTLNPRKLRLIDAIIEEAGKYNTREEIRAAIDLKYPGKWKDGVWQKAWKVFSGYP